MNLVQSLVDRESIQTQRLYPHLTNEISSSYTARNSLSLTIGASACTSQDCSDPKYSLLFPYDKFYANEIIIGFKDDHRYPLNLTILGTKDLFNFDVLYPSITDDFCEENELTHNCKETTFHSYSIPYDIYRGFTIKMNGKDNRGTTQLCIGTFEVVGHFILKYQTCKSTKPLFLIFLFHFIK